MDMCVLVVDDNDPLRDIIVTCLEMEGYHVDAAQGVSAALELIRSNQYDIMLIDENMPGVDGSRKGGVDLLRHVRSQPSSAEIIVMTGNPESETAI